MNDFLNGVARAIAESFELPQPVYEIGSYKVAGQEEIADLRELFPGKEFHGIDMRPGPGVDIAADVERLPLADQSAGTIIAMNTFEHVPRFWKGFEELHRVLRPDGALLISCPFYFYIHAFPSDYWRFTPEALEVLLDRYSRRILGWHGPSKRPRNVWALAFGEKYPPIEPQRIERYKSLVHQYAHERRRQWRVLRYRAARLLVGRGPFAPYLDQNRWETVCHV